MLELLLSTLVPFLPQTEWGDSFNMTLLGSWGHPDPKVEVYSVAAKSGWVFLGTSRGLYILDARDPKDIRVAEVRDAGELIRGVKIHNDLLITIGTPGIEIYQLSADSQGYSLRLLYRGSSSFKSPDSKTLTVYLYVIQDTLLLATPTGKLAFINIANPCKPETVATFNRTVYYLAYHPSGYLYFPITFLADSTDSIPTCGIKVLDVRNLPEVVELDSVVVPGLIWGPLAVNGDYLMELNTGGFGAEGFYLGDDPAHPEPLGTMPLNWGDDFLWRPNWLLYATTEYNGFYVCVYEVKERVPGVLHYRIVGYYRATITIEDITWADGNFYIVPLFDSTTALYIFHYFGDTLPKLSKRPLTFSTFPKNGKLTLNLPTEGDWNLFLYSASGALAFEATFPQSKGQVEVKLPKLGSGVYLARLFEEREGLELRGKVVVLKGG